MQSTEDNADEAFDLIAELREAYRIQSKAAAYLMFDEQGEESERVQLRANLMYMAADTLAAERDRADRAEARLASAPHEEVCMLGFHYEDATVGVCDCWKSEATA